MSFLSVVLAASNLCQLLTLFMIKLRFHHILCLNLYRGLGYSPQFCARMTSLLEQLRTQPDTPIKLVDSPDDLCEACPYLQNNACTQGEPQVKSMDHAAAQLAPLNSRTTYAALQSSIKQNLTPQVFKSCCQTCTWYLRGVCSYEALTAALD